MADEIERRKPDTLSPAPRSFIPRQPTPMHKVFIGISALSLASFILWGLNEFTPLRGVIHVLASRIVLGLVWIAGYLVLAGAIWAVQLGHKRTWVVALSVLWAAMVIALDWWAPIPQVAIPASRPPLEPVAIYMQCQWGSYPITIPAGSAIHLIRLHPDLLKGNPTFVAMGAFHDVTATSKELTWPSKTEGTWPSRAERRGLQD